MLYNALWTSWPCIFTFIFERDVDAKTSLENPFLYGAGPKRKYFNFKIFWRWMLFALFHGAVCFFVPVFILNGNMNSSGSSVTNWQISSASFTFLLHIATYKLFLESTYWNRISVLLGFLSLVLYYVIVVFGSTNSISVLF